MTKERLLKEIDAWIGRSHHEAKLAFERLDLWAALAWGAKVPELRRLSRVVADLPHDSGKEVEAFKSAVGWVATQIDVAGVLQDAFDGAHHEGFEIAWEAGTEDPGIDLRATMDARLRKRRGARAFARECVVGADSGIVGSNGSLRRG
jgi:hypothetical protein